MNKNLIRSASCALCVLVMAAATGGGVAEAVDNDQDTRQLLPPEDYVHAGVLELTPFHSEEEADYFIAAPRYALGDKLYLARNLAVEPEGDINEYFARRKAFTALEVYDSPEYPEPSELIFLEGIEEYEPIYQWLICTGNEFHMEITSGNEPGVHYYLTYDAEGNLINKAKLNGDVKFDPFYLDGSIYYTAYSNALLDRELWKLDTATGQQSRLFKGLVYAACSYDDAKLLIATRAYPEAENYVDVLEVYNPEDGCREIIAELPRGKLGSTVGIVFDSQVQKVYLNSGQAVFGLDILTGELERLYLTTGGAHLSGLAISGDTMMLTAGHNQLLAISEGQ